MLTDQAIKRARADDKTLKLSDESGNGLCLLVQPNGVKLWRVRFRVHGVERMLSAGKYPEVSLKDARAKALDIRRELAAGLDPSRERRNSRVDRQMTFARAVDQYLERRQQEVSQASVDRDRWALTTRCASWRNRPLESIDTQAVLDLLQTLEAKGLGDAPHRVKIILRTFFDFCRDTHLTDANPVESIRRKALKVHKATNFAALASDKAIGELVRKVDALTTTSGVGLQLLLRLACRPGKLRQARWSHFDLTAKTPVWRLPITKNGKPFTAPLSRQVVDILKSWGDAAWRPAGDGLVLPGRQNGPISDNTFNKTLRSLGYDSSQMVSHGVRRLFSTTMHERGEFPSEIIERCLNHTVGSRASAAYNHSEQLSQRADAMQAWSNLLDAFAHPRRK